MRPLYRTLHLNLLKISLIIFSTGLGTLSVLAQRPEATMAEAEARRVAMKEDSAYVRDNYKKLEIMVPMRDGAKLYTGVYMPKDSSKKYPIMLCRSPYGSGPYGAATYKTLIGPSMLFAHEGFIIVYQDVRGRYMSEGDFVATRP
jgi:predicted acyl esterase